MVCLCLQHIVLAESALADASMRLLVYASFLQVFHSLHVLMHYHVSTQMSRHRASACASSLI